MALEAGDEEFVSQLDEISQKKAKEELNELNEKDRAIAVQTLRKWVLETDWLKSPTDFSFLLRFLRARKFSQLGARQSLENYWTLRTNVPEYFRNVDPADPTIQAILRTGFISSPKKLDKHGRRLFIIRLGKIDVDNFKKWGLDNVFKAWCLVFDWMSYDENVQVNGLASFADYSNLTMSIFMTIVTPKVSNIMMKYIQKAVPMRIKRLHEYKEPVFFDAMMAIIGPFMSQKMKDRQVLHGRSLVKIYEDIGQEVLPREYLPDDYTGECVGTTSQVIDEMLSSMAEEKFRNYIMDLSCDKYGVDVNMRKQEPSVMEASFRKLNVE